MVLGVGEGKLVAVEGESIVKTGGDLTIAVGVGVAITFPDAVVRGGVIDTTLGREGEVSGASCNGSRIDLTGFGENIEVARAIL